MSRFPNRAAIEREAGTNTRFALDQLERAIQVLEDRLAGLTRDVSLTPEAPSDEPCSSRT